MTRLYKRGPRVRRDGYIDVWEPTHPLARRDGYVFQHRKMAWDAGLLTDPTLQVHHLNEVRHDSRLDNFVVKSGATHTREHQEERGWVTNQFGTWDVKPSDQRQSAPRPERVRFPCEATFSTERRRDAVYCSIRCQVTAWKRAHR